MPGVYAMFVSVAITEDSFWTLKLVVTVSGPLLVDVACMTCIEVASLIVRRTP